VVAAFVLAAVLAYHHETLAWAFIVPTLVLSGAFQRLCEIGAAEAGAWALGRMGLAVLVLVWATSLAVVFLCLAAG